MKRIEEEAAETAKLAAMKKAERERVLREQQQEEQRKKAEELAKLREEKEARKREKEKNALVLFDQMRYKYMSEVHMPLDVVVEV
jgi:hypothetical protein